MDFFFKKQATHKIFKIHYLAEHAKRIWTDIRKKKPHVLKMSADGISSAYLYKKSEQWNNSNSTGIRRRLPPISLKNPKTQFCLAGSNDLLSKYIASVCV